MCIRDRADTAHAAGIFLEHRNFLQREPQENTCAGLNHRVLLAVYPENADPVSYTHLDVYKRQM